MTHLIEILTALALGGSIVGGGFRAMTKLTRLVDAIEHLSASMEQVVRTIGKHEKRIGRLERRKRACKGPPP